LAESDHFGANETRFYGDRFKIYHVLNFMQYFSGPVCTLRKLTFRAVEIMQRNRVW